MTPPRHFLTLMDLSASELRALIHRASALKAQRRAGDSSTQSGRQDSSHDFYKSVHPNSRLL